MRGERAAARRDARVAVAKAEADAAARNPHGTSPPDGSNGGSNGHRRAPFLLVCGHVNLDVLIQVKQLPQSGASEPVLQRRTAWGGTAANIARHAGGLGVATRLWGRVGDDFPAPWRAAFEADGVELALDEVRGAATPTCFILTDLLDRQSYCMDQGPMAHMAEYPPSPTLLDGLDKRGWVHLSTGDPLAYAHLATAAGDRGINVALDPGQELRFNYDTRSFEGLLELSDALFLNEFELRVACDFLKYAAPEQFLDHVDTVVVTRGQRGASLYRSKHKPLHLPAFPVHKVVDPTGAGDALRSGWYAALASGLDMATAIQWGQATAAIVLQHPGPQEHVVRPGEIQSVLTA